MNILRKECGVTAIPNFRFHRGSLEESLKTEVVEVENIKMLHEMVCSQLQDYSISESALIIEFYGYDHRMGKEMYSVRIYGIGIVGFLDSEFIS
ncbi:hypothetical protein [Lysinibacillus fusiformis]